MESMAEMDRFCKVCGDKAVYVNYGALTCDSCKTFFRRQNLHPKNLSCSYNERCVINSKTRKDCTKCRLIKCFAIGMRSDVIGSATSERQRKMTLVQNGSLNHDLPRGSFGHDHLRHILHRERSGSDSNSGSSDDASKIVFETILQNQPFFQTRQSTSHLELDDRRSPPPVMAKKKCSSEPLLPLPSLKRQEYERSFQSLNHLETTYCYTRCLSSEESVHIDAIRDAAAAIRSRVFVTDDAQCSNPIMAAVKLQSFGVDKLIAGMSQIDSFKILDDGLKSILLKGACAEMMLVRSSMHFDHKNKGWTINAVQPPAVAGNASERVSFHLSIDLFCKLPGASTEWMKDYFTFCELLDPAWKKDEVLLTLLKLLILFNPENVAEADIKEIKYHQTYYQFMMKRYLETTSPSLIDATRAFDRLKEARRLLRRLKTSFENTVLNLSSGDMLGSLGALTNSIVPKLDCQTPALCNGQNSNVENIENTNPSDLSDRDSESAVAVQQIIPSTSTLRVSLKNPFCPLPRGNPFASSVALPLTNPAAFWAQKSSPVLEQQLLK